MTELTNLNLQNLANFDTKTSTPQNRMEMEDNNDLEKYSVDLLENDGTKVNFGQDDSP